MRRPRWTRTLLGTVALTALSVAFMLGTSMGPNVALVVGLGGLSGAAVWLLASVVGPAAPAIVWRSGELQDSSRTGLDSLERGWRYRVPASQRDDRAADRLHQLLVEILDARLTAHHGIDRRQQPEAARQILGDELARFADDPRAASALPQLRNATRIVARIEQI